MGGVNSEIGIICLFYDPSSNGDVENVSVLKHRREIKEVCM